MKRLTIPQLGRKVSCLGMGTVSFSPKKRGVAFELLDGFFAAGGNLIDTAECYGAGASEKTVAMWLAERGCRDRAVIVDKGCESGSITPDKIRDAISVNLERLGTDCVDIWLLHRDDPEKPAAIMIDTLNEEVDNGRIRCFGASNWTVSRLIEANEYAEKNGLIGMAASSPHLSLATAKEPYWPGCMTATEEDRAWHAGTQLPLFAWSSQARGFFSGRFTPQDTSDADMVRVFYSDQNFEKLRRAEQLGRKKGATAIQIALAYVLHQPFPTVALIGPENGAELESSLAAERIGLTAEEIAWLELQPD